MTKCKIKINPHVLHLMATHIDYAYPIKPSFDIANLATIAAHKELAQDMTLKALSKSFASLLGGKMSYKMNASQGLMIYDLFNRIELIDTVAREVVEVCRQLEEQLFIKGPFTIIKLRK